MRLWRCKAGRVARVIVVATLGLLCPGGAGAGDLTMEQQRGRQLFFKGAIEGQATPGAQIGSEVTAAPATVAPCANCHGEDGHGRAEGAIDAPDIGWRSLGNPVGHVHRDGRRHGPFSQESFTAAVSQGVDPSGARLDTIMPRYNFTRDQIDALIAYLKIIDADQSPGVTTDKVRVGVLLPKSLVSGPAGQSVLGALRGVFDPLNSAGGLFGRRIALEIVAPEASDGSSEGRAPELFALLDPSLAPPEIRVSRPRTPLIAAIAPLARDETDSDPYSFYVFGGVRENIDALLAYLSARSDAKHSPVAVVYQNEAAGRDALPVVARLSAVYGWPPPLSVGYEPSDVKASEMAERLQAQGVGAVVFLGDASALYPLLRTSDARAWRPYFLLPAPTIDGGVFALPATIAQRLFLAYPLSDADPSVDIGVNPYRSEAGRHAAAARTAYCIAQMTIAGLKEAGRELGAARFVSALERLSKFETGGTHPLSFGPERRIGAPGAYVVGVDVAARRFIRLSEWLEGGDMARNAQ